VVLVRGSFEFDVVVMVYIMLSILRHPIVSLERDTERQNIGTWIVNTFKAAAHPWR
jgi:hypothetical protein